MIAKALADTRKEVLLHPGIETEIQVARKMSMAFGKPLGKLPKAMINEIFAYGWEKTNEGRDQILGDFCDLLLLDYDELNDPLSLEDWEFISDVISEYGTVIDMDLVEYVMMRVVEHKAL